MGKFITEWNLKVNYLVYTTCTKSDPMTQGRGCKFLVKASDLWPKTRSLQDVTMTVDLGDLGDWDFGDMKSQSHWVCSSSLSPPIYKKGTTPRDITSQQAKYLG